MLNHFSQTYFCCCHTKYLRKEGLENGPLPAQDIYLPNGYKLETYDEGPDQIVPSDNIWTSEPNGRVKLQLDPEDEVASHPPLSVPGMLARAAANWPQVPALAHKQDGQWTYVSYREYEQIVRTVAKAFLALGLEKYHGVGILGFNTPEWFYSALGAIHAGGFSVGIYTTNSPDACHHCLYQSRANICVVEDDKQLQKILKVKDELPQLRAIVQYSGTPAVEGVLSWADLMQLGEKQEEAQLEQALKKIAINECCTLVFTSGTEGKPKAAMLSHDNLTFEVFATARYLAMEDGGVESIVSYLPLSHIAALICDLFGPILVGGTTYFADKDALKGSLVVTLREVRPSMFVAVPRVWEKMQEQLAAAGARASGLQRTFVAWAREAALQHHLAVMTGQTNLVESARYSVYHYLVFGHVKVALGLDRAKVCLNGAAPVSVDVKRFFLGLDIIITDTFGMSECSGSHCMSKPEDFRLGLVGRTDPGKLTRIDRPEPDGQGEICLKGRNVMMGYLGDAEKTRAAIDADGWLHSGDLGTIDGDGYLAITGRIKELLITAGGENIPPVLIEQTVKNELPCVSNAQLIGDGRKFLSVLLTLKTKMDPDSGAPKDELADDVKTWARDLGCPVNTVSEVLDGPKKEIMDAIQEGINRANEKAISNAQRVQKFAILPADFSIQTGELGPTLKLKRTFVYQKYADVIENFYKDT